MDSSPHDEPLRVLWLTTLDGQLWPQAGDWHLDRLDLARLGSDCSALQAYAVIVCDQAIQAAASCPTWLRQCAASLDDGPEVVLVFATNDELDRFWTQGQARTNGFEGEVLVAEDPPARSTTTLARVQQRRRRQLRAERAQTQRLSELERERALLQRIYDTAGIGLCVTDERGEFVKVNPAYCRQYGYSEDELIGQHFTTVVPEHMREAAARMHDAFIDGALELPGEWQVQRRDGGVREVFVTAGLMAFAKGERLKVTTVADVTDKRTTERWLQLVERAVEASEDGVLIADLAIADQPIIYANPAMERISGYSREEFQGRNCRFLQRSDRDQEGVALMRAAIATGQPARCTLRNYRKDGTLFWNQMYLAPVTCGDGTISHFVAISRDVTEQIDILRALSRSEERLRSLFQGSLVGVCVTDRSDRILEANAALADMLGMETPEALRGVDMGRFIHPDDVLERVTARQDLVRGVREASLYQCRCRAQSGLMRTCLVKTTLMKAEGEEHETFLSVMIDVSDRVAAEQRNQRLQRRYKLALEATRDVVFDWSIDDDRFHVNEAFWRLLGSATADARRQAQAMTLEDWIAYVDPADQPRVRERIAEHLRGNSDEFRVEHRLLRSDGRRLWVVGRGRIVERTGAGSAQRMVGTLADIDRERRLERERDQSLERVIQSERLAAVGRLVASVAHEMNNPLGGMLNAAKTLQRHADNPDAVRRGGALLERGIEHLAGLVNSLRADIDPDRLDAFSAADAEHIESLMRTEARSRGVDLRMHCAFEGHGAPIPAGPLRQILINLILNALQAVSDRTDRRVMVTCKDLETAIGVSICDSGPGISASILPRLFEPFVTDRHGGGLGLWITHRLVQDLGGTINASSDEAGTCFEVTLPKQTGGNTSTAVSGR
mgnify:CR=1 FL=1